MAAIALATSALTPLAVQAQEQSSTPAPAPTANAIGEIVVTAQKRTERLVNVPIALTAVSGGSLQKAGVADMGSLAQVVPGLHVDASGAFFMPSIRGVGTAIAGAGASNNVATYVDGVFKPNALSNDFDFIDVDSVQVLKGPQGTLFGRNSTGGAIVVTTKTPVFEPRLDLQASYGSFNTFTGSMWASDKVTDKLAVSLSLGATHSDGWVKNIVTDQSANPIEDFSGRLKFLYLPSDQLKFTLTFDAFRQNDPSLYAASSYKGESTAALFGVPLSIGNPRQVALSGLVAHIAEGGGATLKSEANLGFATLTSYSAGHWDSGVEATNEMAAPFPANGSLPVAGAFPGGVLAGNLPFAVENANWTNHENTFSQEFDLGRSGHGPIDWVTGLYYYFDSTTYSPFNLGLYGPFGPGGLFSVGPQATYPAGAYVNTGDQRTEAFTDQSYTAAVFADATYNLGNWHFTAGGRYSVDRATANYIGYPTGLVTLLSGAPQTLVSAGHDWYSFIPRAVIRYSLTPDSNVYLSVSQGNKSGLFNSSGFDTQRTPLKPENITDVEAGYKIARHDWRLEISAFHYDYTNLQVSTYEGGTSFLQNAPAAEIYGGDIHWQQHFAEHFSVDLGLAYTHARYTDFTTAAYQTFSPATGVVNGTKDVSGDPMERTPEFTGNIGLDYNAPAFGGVVDLNANYNYQTKSSFDFASSLVQGAYGLLNLRAAWTDPQNKWTFSVIGKNVANTVYAVEVLPNAGGFGETYGQPTSVMFQIQYKY